MWQRRGRGGEKHDSRLRIPIDFMCPATIRLRLCVDWLPDASEAPAQTIRNLGSSTFFGPPYRSNISTIHSKHPPPITGVYCRLCVIFHLYNGPVVILTARLHLLPHSFRRLEFRTSSNGSPKRRPAYSLHKTSELPS